VTANCSATWYDGLTALRREVTLTVEGASLTVSGEGIELRYLLEDLRIDPRLGSVRRMLRCPDGATAETSADLFLDELLRRQGKGGFFRRVHHWESSLGRAFAALLLTLLTAYCFVSYGVPFLAAKAAFALPPATEELMGRETLQVLDRLVLKPSKLPEERRRELRRLFSSMAVRYPERAGWRIEFRSGEAVGANAFALPSGIVIITDKLVQLAKNDHEIAGVLAHEIGHVNYRHALRHLLQNSATALLVATLTGDISSISSVAATMPTVLIAARYSRSFEREADDAAVVYLKGEGIPVRAYAEMLARLDADHWQERERVPRFGELLDSHPLMLERVNRVMENAR